MKIHPTLEPVRQLGRRGAHAGIVRRSSRPPALKFPTPPRAQAILWIEGVLLLVMAVSAVTIVRPWFDAAPATQTLRRGADELRVLWNQTRQWAITTGSTWQFDYNAGTGEYYVHCIRRGDGAMISTLYADDLSSNVRGYLASNLGFVSVQTTMRPTSTRIGQHSFNIEDQAIRFFSDGSTSTARVVLRDEHDQYIVVRIQGINGSVAIEEPRGL